MNALAKSEQVTMSLHFSPFKGAWVLTTVLPSEPPVEDVLTIAQAEYWKKAGVPNVTSDAHTKMIPAMLDIFY